MKKLKKLIWLIDVLIGLLIGIFSWFFIRSLWLIYIIAGISLWTVFFQKRLGRILIIAGITILLFYVFIFLEFIFLAIGLSGVVSFLKYAIKGS